MERAPEELFAAMPPSVQRVAVEGSTGKKSPSFARRAFSSASTTPGSTLAVFASGSTSTIRFR